MYLKAFIQSFGQIGTVVSEKIGFEFLYVHDLGPRSRNDLDLQYSHIFIYYIQSSEIQENIVDIYCIFYIFTSENIKSFIFTPQECTYNFFGLPLTFPLTYCSALQNFKRL